MKKREEGKKEPERVKCLLTVAPFASLFVAAAGTDGLSECFAAGDRHGWTAAVGGYFVVGVIESRHNDSGSGS